MSASAASISRRPEVVLLDVNGTLSDTAPLRDAFARAGAPRTLLDAWLAATLRDGLALAAAGGYARFLDVAGAAIRVLLARVDGLRTGREEAAATVLTRFSQLDVHPDVPEGLRRLEGAGIRVATLTNGSAASAEALLERAGVRGLVERCLSVDDVRRWKPAPEPYLHAAHVLGVEPGSCALVTVHPWDVDGARRAGLRAAWLDRDDAPYPEIFLPPDASAASLAGMVDALAGAGVS